MIGFISQIELLFKRTSKKGYCFGWTGDILSALLVQFPETIEHNIGLKQEDVFVYV